MEPIAVMGCVEVRMTDAAHQRIQHFVTDAMWDDHDVRLAAARYALKAITQRADLLMGRGRYRLPQTARSASV
jgi:hypothetical protein